MLSMFNQKKVKEGLDFAYRKNSRIMVQVGCEAWTWTFVPLFMGSTDETKAPPGSPNTGKEITKKD